VLKTASNVLELPHVLHVLQSLLWSKEFALNALMRIVKLVLVLLLAHVPLALPTTSCSTANACIVLMAGGLMLVQRDVNNVEKQTAMSALLLEPVHAQLVLKIITWLEVAALPALQIPLLLLDQMELRTVKHVPLTVSLAIPLKSALSVKLVMV